MSQQILLRVSLPIAFVRLAQTVVPALVIALTLYVIARLNDQYFDQLFLALAAIAAVLSGILLQPPKQDAPILQIDAGMMAIDMLFRWAITMGLLFGVGYITGFAEHFPRRIVGLWVIVAPLLAFGTALVLQILMRRVVMSRENQRSAVIVGVNGASLQLAGKLADNPELCTSVAGYFDDRARGAPGGAGQTPAARSPFRTRHLRQVEPHRRHLHRPAHPARAARDGPAGRTARLHRLDLLCAGRLRIRPDPVAYR